jgi:hypothetical protein
MMSRDIDRIFLRIQVMLATEFAPKIVILVLLCEHSAP